MNNNRLTYKGYFTEIHYSEEDKILFGKVEGISDIINFESESSKEIEEEFHKAVDDYLKLCKELGKSPERAYKGTFNVRISPKLHRDLTLYAEQHGETLNFAVEKAIEDFLRSKEPPAYTVVMIQSEEKEKYV